MKQSLFQQNRNNAIIRFIDAYVGLQGLYRQILSQTFDLNKIGNSNFYSLIDDKYEQLYSSYFYFKFYLDPLEQVRYADLVTEMQNIFAKIADVATKSSSDDKNLLIADLLDVSKIQAGRIVYDITEFDFDEFVDQSLEGIQHLSVKHKIIKVLRSQILF